MVHSVKIDTVQYMGQSIDTYPHLNNKNPSTQLEKHAFYFSPLCKLISAEQDGLQIKVKFKMWNDIT